MDESIQKEYPMEINKFSLPSKDRMFGDITGISIT
jgi:hypothetical protein